MLGTGKSTWRELTPGRGKIKGTSQIPSSSSTGQQSRKAHGGQQKRRKQVNDVSFQLSVRIYHKAEASVPADGFNYKCKCQKTETCELLILIKNWSFCDRNIKITTNLS